LARHGHGGHVPPLHDLKELRSQLAPGPKILEPRIGPDDLLTELKKRLINRVLDSELTTHLGYNKHQSPPASASGGPPNARNGDNSKHLLSDDGKPKAGETLVVAAATGPVGATVGQIGKILGCRVIGIAGGAEKCKYAVKTLGLNVCLDHHSSDFSKELVAATPEGNRCLFRECWRQDL
jgi:hypothetical protein